jgi:hypothetical protein
MYTFSDRVVSVDLKAAAVTPFDIGLVEETPMFRIFSGETLEHGEVVGYVSHAMPIDLNLDRDSSGIP